MEKEWFNYEPIVNIINSMLCGDSVIALENEPDDETFVHNLTDYLASIQFMYMFVRVRRRLKYVKRQRVFSFKPRYMRLRDRLQTVPATFLEFENYEQRRHRMLTIGPTNEEIAAARAKYPPNNGQTSLDCAVDNDDLKCVLIFLGEFDVSELNDRDQSVLSYAKTPKIVHLLLTAPHGLDVINLKGPATTTAGRTPLMQAAFSNNTDVVDALLSYDEIDVMKKSTIGGNTALHYAAQWTDNERIIRALVVVSRLLGLGNMLLNNRNATNDTALSIAAQEGHTAVVKALLTYDNIDLRFPRYAMDRIHGECARLLDTYRLGDTGGAWLTSTTPLRF